jgi:hypothetical protein
MFDNNKSPYGDERTTRKTFRKALCNKNNTKEDIGC